MEDLYDADYGLPPSRRRGIQAGQVAMSASSKVLHDKTSVITSKLYQEYKGQHPRLIWKPALSPADLIELGNLITSPKEFAIAGVRPDGGIFLYDHPTRGMLPLFSVEAKDQQDLGNAIERWFKNYTALKNICPQIGYVTFCTGGGAHKTGQITKALNHAILEHAYMNRERVPRSWNRLYFSGPSFYRRKGGFTTRQITIVLRALLDQKLAELERR